MDAHVRRVSIRLSLASAAVVLGQVLDASGSPCVGLMLVAAVSFAVAAVLAPAPSLGGSGDDSSSACGSAS